jgi:hypothetical protein
MKIVLKPGAAGLRKGNSDLPAVKTKGNGDQGKSSGF